MAAPDRPEFTIVPLTADTWPLLDALLAAHNGVFGGCWCLDFHAEGADKSLTPAQRRAAKEALVARGAAHAALVLDAAECVGWCQFGPTAELPRIKLRRAYDQPIATGTERLPDWRITCFFVGRGHRRQGVARAALAGALDLIAQAGGGVVEAYPEAVEGRRVSSSFLWAGTIPMFAAFGFDLGRQLGKNTWVVRRAVAPA
jgi:GNAT superfamily N-acetyltransferase